MPHLVLVVDDDRDIRETLIEILEDHGYRALGASNGVEALEALRTAILMPCVILLDLMMPVMDGREFRERQLDSPTLAAIPVIAISAYGDVHAQAAALAVEFLRKPLASASLLAAVRRHCDGELRS